MFRVEMFPAGRGDCLWVEYGDPAGPRRMLIDGGVPSTAVRLRERIEALPPEQRRFELVVVSHIDLDHIGGVVELLRDPPAGLQVGDVWFNGFKHLPRDPGELGPNQGEELTHILERRHAETWNAAFDHHAVATGDDLPVVELAGGMKLTLLSPTPDRLRRLRTVWEREIEKAGLKDRRDAVPAHDPEDEGLLGGHDVDRLAGSAFHNDSSVANASSIAMVAEHGGKRCLFAGDAFAPDLAAALDRLATAEGEPRAILNAVKLSHHGGRKNTSRELLDRVACSRYLFSTDGSYYKHPHAESVARILVHGRSAGPPELFFNYRSDENARWEEIPRNAPRYTPVYPGAGSEGMAVDL